MRISELFISKKTEMYIRQLYPGSEADRRIRLLGKKKASLFIKMITATVVVFIPVFIYGHARSNLPVTKLERNGHGKGTKIVTVNAVTGDGYEDSIKIEVAERRYTDAELEVMSEKLDEQLWEKVLGDNPDPENVMYDLLLEDHVEGYPFAITWKSERPLILGSSGKIDTERLALEDPENRGIAVNLCATLKYKDYTEEKYATFILRRKPQTAEGMLKDDIEASIEDAGRSSETEEVQLLPDTAGGHRITFYDASPNAGYIILFAGTVSAFLMMAVRDRRIKEEAENRKKQMEADHPLILNQYMLYYMAGMNPRAIWTQICRRYEENLDKKGKERRYAYEEMLIAKNRIDEGGSELAAYDEFAARCDSILYRSFISFVRQAVVKGNDRLQDILYEEVDKAQRERNNRVKIRASEAETKLLLPMFMMLVVVLVVVMVPAFTELR